jgi:hypothetical protein
MLRSRSLILYPSYRFGVGITAVGSFVNFYFASRGYVGRDGIEEKNED